MSRVYKKKTDKVYKKHKASTPETVDALVANYKNRPLFGTNPLYMDKSVDRRSKVVHRFNRIRDTVISDLGGNAILSEGQRQIATQAAALSVIQEAFLQKFLENPDFIFETSKSSRTNLDEYSKLITNVSRLYKSLGLERHTKDITDLSLKDYVTKYESVEEPIDIQVEEE